MKNHPHDNIYAIIGKLETIKAKDTPNPVAETKSKAKSRLVENIETVESKLLREFKEGELNEGAKVDRLVKHVKDSEVASGKSGKKATDIAWATANKRGMLDNKNKTNEAVPPKQTAQIKKGQEQAKKLNKDGRFASEKFTKPVSVKKTTTEGEQSIGFDWHNQMANSTTKQQKLATNAKKFNLINPKNNKIAGTYNSQQEADSANRKWGGVYKVSTSMEETAPNVTRHTGNYGTSYYDSPEHTGEEVPGAKKGKGRPKKAEHEKASAALPQFKGPDVKVKAPAHAVTRHSMSDAPPKGSPEYAEYAAKQARSEKRKAKLKEAQARRIAEESKVTKHTGTYGTSYYSSPEHTGNEAPKEKLGRGRPKKAEHEKASAVLPFSSKAVIPTFGKDTGKEAPKVPAHAVTRHSMSDVPPKGSPEYAEYAAKQARAAKRKGKNLKETMQLLARRLSEGVNFRQMAEETHQSIDKLMSELQKDIAEYKATGHCSDALKDFLQVHQYSQKAVDNNVAAAVVEKSSAPMPGPAPVSKPMFNPADRELNELARLAGLGDPTEDFSWDPVDKPHAPDYEPEHEVVDEGGMSDLDLLMQELGTGEADIYNVMNHPNTRVEQAASSMLQKMYDDVVIDTQLHPDDDFEQIFDIMADHIAKEHPALAEAGIDFDEPGIEPINGPKEEYQTMRQSSLNPGEGDFGEKDMFPRSPMTGDNRMAKVPAFEEVLMAEYESIKRVTEGRDVEMDQLQKQKDKIGMKQYTVKRQELIKKYSPKTVSEGRMNELSLDIKELTDAEFKKKYNKSKAEMKSSLDTVNSNMSEASNKCPICKKPHKENTDGNMKYCQGHD